MSSHRPLAPPPPSPQVLLQPGDGAHDVSPSALISARAVGGVLDAVTLTGPNGQQAQGTLTTDRQVWTVAAPLAYGTTYTWSGSVTNPAGQHTPIAGTFTTVAPANQVHATSNIEDGQIVGIAAPIILQFDGTVQNKAAVEQALTVQTTPYTEGSWAWLPDTDEGSRLHWRPKDYWAPGTQVNFTAKLYGTDFGSGSYGAEDLTEHFTIGRSQIVKADATTHQITIVRDGQPVATYPASYGLDSDPDRTTHSGIHVVTEKDQTERMVSQRYHYDLIEYWAVRISNNGEFIHANPASASAQGNSNVTHGCINLSTADAEDYFNSAIYGDPVEVTGTGVALTADDGDIYDWTVPWDQWRAMSALQ